MKTDSLTELLDQVVRKHKDPYDNLNGLEVWHLSQGRRLGSGEKAYGWHPSMDATRPVLAPAECEGREWDFWLKPDERDNLLVVDAATHVIFDPTSGTLHGRYATATVITEAGRNSGHTGKPSRWHVQSVRVEDEHQHQGHGRALMQAAIELAERHGKHLELRVYEDNEAARALYESLGFAYKGKKKAQAGWSERGKWCRALLMVRKSQVVTP